MPSFLKCKTDKKLAKKLFAIKSSFPPLKIRIWGSYMVECVSGAFNAVLVQIWRGVRSEEREKIDFLKCSIGFWCDELRGS